MVLVLCLLAALLQDALLEEPAVNADDVRAAGRVAGLEFTDDEIALMLSGVRDNLAAYQRLRAEPVDNALEPALVFDPLVAGVSSETWLPAAGELVLPTVERPADDAELLWLDVLSLASLVRSRQLSCRELVELSLARLKAVDDELHCVITYTEERARAQADALDAELARGVWRGPLHGLPWGAKDLLAVAGYRTTWGAKPYTDQVLDLDATVVQRLDAAGAVLVAKLSLGALAWGDVWFDAQTRNPWNPEQGSSGSSAGPAAAVTAGCVCFAIGSETLGSIVSPSERCGASALRPTFGRVSRHGAMALAWSMDKLGPMGRSLDDMALVLAAIVGPDGLDTSVVDRPYRAPGPVDVSGWKVGYLAEAFRQSGRHGHVLEELKLLGVELVPIELPDAPVAELMFILSAEAACAFDELTRSGQDDLLVRQIEQAWPNVFRVARLVPAVEYLRANRLRTRLCRDMQRALGDVVAYLHPSFGGGSLSITNLTGHPAVVAPCGYRQDGTPFGITFTGRLYDEARLLALAGAWQRSTEYHKPRPVVN